MRFDKHPTLPLDLPAGPDWSLERRALSDLGGPVAGTDEAGRGPLAGPVVAAAVILDEKAIPKGLNDSKKLTERLRSALFEDICQTAVVAVAAASTARIDRTNIRQASLWAMAIATASLSIQPKALLVDGRDVPDDLVCPGRAVIKGDARSLSIAAASIVAKVVRDRMMIRMAEVYPAYGFNAHKGYGTAAHLEALREHGPCPHHRISFKPVRALVDEMTSNP